MHEAGCDVTKLDRVHKLWENNLKNSLVLFPGQVCSGLLYIYILFYFCFCFFGGQDVRLAC